MHSLCPHAQHWSPDHIDLGSSAVCTSCSTHHSMPITPIEKGTPMAKKKHRSTAAPGYEVVVNVLRLEKLAGSKNANPRWRLHTDSGLYLTEPDIQRAHELIGDESGPAVLLMQGDKVVDWTFQGAQTP